MASHLTSWSSILQIAIPSVLLNAAPNVTVTLQTALLGRYGGRDTQAAFGAVATTANTVCFLFNFLVDGVSAKIGSNAGAMDWRALSKHVKLAIACGLAGGILACGTLAAMKQPIAAFLDLQPEVQQQANSYWWIRVALTPLVLLNMTISGILQGYNQVTAASVLISLQSLLEIGSSMAVFTIGTGHHGSYLRNMGLCTILAAVISACAGVTLVQLLQPRSTESGPEDLTDPLMTAGSLDSPVAPDLLLHNDEEAVAVMPAVPSAPNADGDGNDGDMLSFLSDGASMIIRSTLLQATFFIALAVASRLGTAALAAHQIVAQLWLLTSYVVDGFAVSGTVLGSRLASKSKHRQETTASLRNVVLLCRRVLTSGVVIGIACGVAFYVAESSIIAVFTKDHATIGLLKNHLWLVICIAQPLNSLVFIYDGLLYASQSFKFTRNIMLCGFFAVFLPLILFVQWQVQTLWGIWAAKAALNACRLLGGVYRIHVWWPSSLTEHVISAHT